MNTRDLPRDHHRRLRYENVRDTAREAAEEATDRLPGTDRRHRIWRMAQTLGVTYAEAAAVDEVLENEEALERVTTELAELAK